jgi:hypothetical protein
MSAGQVRSNLRTHTLEEKRGHHGQSSEGSRAGPQERVSMTSSVPELEPSQARGHESSDNR